MVSVKKITTSGESRVQMSRKCKDDSKLIEEELYQNRAVRKRGMLKLDTMRLIKILTWSNIIKIVMTIAKENLSKLT